MGATLRGLWFSEAPMAAKLAVFIARVQNTLFLAAEAMVVNTTDLVTFDVTLLKMLRSLYGGVATTESDDNYVTTVRWSMSTQQIWQRA